MAPQPLLSQTLLIFAQKNPSVLLKKAEGF